MRKASQHVLETTTVASRTAARKATLASSKIPTTRSADQVLPYISIASLAFDLHLNIINKCIKFPLYQSCG